MIWLGGSQLGRRRWGHVDDDAAFETISVLGGQLADQRQKTLVGHLGDRAIGHVLQLDELQRPCFWKNSRRSLTMARLIAPQALISRINR